MEGERGDSAGLDARYVLLPLNVDDFWAELSFLARTRFGLSDERFGVLKKF